MRRRTFAGGFLVGVLFLLVFIAWRIDRTVVRVVGGRDA